MTKKIMRIKELVKLLNKASDAYYNTGYPIMEDYDFDLLIEELKILEKETGFVLSNSPTHNVGAPVIVTSIHKVTHQKPMLSLDKCHDTQALINFAGKDNCYLSVKCDGLSTRLTYQDGILVSAATRGNGVIGQDVLFHVKHYINIPMVIPYKNKLIIDGESVIFYQDFERINEPLSVDKKFKNPRNLASGTLGNLDTKITKQRNMRFVAWRVIAGLDGDSNFFNLKEIEKWGFMLPPMFTYNNKSYDQFHLSDMLHKLRSQANQIGLPMDGCVMAKDSITLAESMGRTEKFFLHSIAYKFEDDVYETELVDIEWTVGRTGVIVPTAIFKPVEIDGTEVSRASVHNVSVLTDLALMKGDTIEVYKANMIIPQVKRNISAEEKDKTGGITVIDLPKVCPVCGSKTELKETDNSMILMCTNPNCTAKKIAQFAHFVSRNCMNIDGLSEKTLEVLISNGYISDFKSIYSLSNHYDKLIKLDGFGAKSVQKLLVAIEKSRDVKLENFITALGIPNIGLSAAKTIAKYCKGDFMALVTLFATSFDWIKLDDFGKVMADSLNTYYKKHGLEMRSLAAIMRFVVPEETITDNSLDGLTFCITGSFSQSRDDLKKKLEAKGAKFVSSVSKNLDVLFCGDKAGSKLTKAENLGVRVAYEDELMEMLGE